MGKLAACLPPRAAGQVKGEVIHTRCPLQDRVRQALEPAGMTLLSCGPKQRGNSGSSIEGT